MEITHKAIPGNKWAIFEERSHLPHAEEAEEYLEVFDALLTKVEG